MSIDFKIYVIFDAIIIRCPQPAWYEMNAYAHSSSRYYSLAYLFITAIPGAVVAFAITIYLLSSRALVVGRFEMAKTDREDEDSMQTNKS